MFHNPADLSNWLEIDLSVIEANLRVVRSVSGVEIMAVVKADAYGYGMVQVAQTALRAGAVYLAVARVDEALRLREAGIWQPILILGMVPIPHIDLCIANGFTLPAASFEAVDLYSRRAGELGLPLLVHIKLDTGMGRLGMFPEQAPALARRILSRPMLRLEGMFSHLANADRQEDPGVYAQIKRFRQGLESLQAAGIRLRWVHLANSAAALGYPAARFNMVRGAQMLIGHNPFSDRALPAYLQRALQGWKAHLLYCRPCKAGDRVEGCLNVTMPRDALVGLVSVGYGDGYWRRSGSQVLIDGKRQPVIGLPGFDCTAVQLDQEYPVGSEVALAGIQGDQMITIQDLAVWWNTGPGKITSVIPAHVPRLYVDL